MYNFYINKIDISWIKILPGLFLYIHWILHHPDIDVISGWMNDENENVSSSYARGRRDDAAYNAAASAASAAASAAAAATTFHAATDVIAAAAVCAVFHNSLLW